MCDENKIVLYDGECGLCHGFVGWLLRRSGAETFRFAPLQGDTARAMRKRFDGFPADLTTVVFVEGNRFHVRSHAVFHILKHLRFPWRPLAALRVIPSPVTDFAYNLVASVRYAIFGRRDHCIVPGPAIRQRFLP